MDDQWTHMNSRQGGHQILQDKDTTLCLQGGGVAPGSEEGGFISTSPFNFLDRMFGAGRVCGGATLLQVVRSAQTRSHGSVKASVCVWGGGCI